MKRFNFLLLVVPFLVFSQTEEDRSAIRSSYNLNEIKNFKLRTDFFLENQKTLIDEFLSYSKSNNYNRPRRILDGEPLFSTTNNNGTFGSVNGSSVSTIRANRLYSGGDLGLNLDGSDIYVGLWDDGSVVVDHQEFTNSRVTQVDVPAIVKAHPTHVAGTIAAGGFKLVARGIAYNANVLAYDWNDDTTEMIDFGSKGYLVSNHSYGNSLAYVSTWRFGAYDQDSKDFDDISFNFPYYQIVVAAGNDRTATSNAQVSSKNGFDLLSGISVSKNALTVAAVEGLFNYSDVSSVVMSSFSNYGPTDDGRIKPDISAKGVGIYSCSTGINGSTSSYAVLSGTSMAAPAITGLIALLQGYYSGLTTPNTFMKASQVRGLICHTADEANYNDGPDYQFGWGLANAEAAALVISGKNTTSLLELNTLTQGGVFSKKVTVNSLKKLGVTICWTDPSGVLTTSGLVDSRSSKLVNNLDLKVKRNGVTYYPWKLDVENPTDGATRISDNNVDNIEKVQIDLADPGEYTIEVSHKGSLQGGSQEFALIATGFDSLLENNSFDFNNNVVIYPNPATNLLNFSTPSGDALSNVAIYDALGKEIKISKSVLNNTLDISELSNGLYIAKFFHNGKLMVNKFIKK
jgi:serine protease AprX